MAKQASKAPADRGLQIDESATYSVSLKRRVDRGGGVFLIPGRKTKVSGKVLLEIMEDVNDFGPASAAP